MIHASKGRPITLDSSVNFVWDGNSLVLGSLTANQTVQYFVSQSPQLAYRGTSYVNCGRSGYSWAMMHADPAAVHAAWAPGKTNVLVLWEHTNSIYNESKTAAQTLADMRAYIAARRAYRPWVVAVLGTIPREGDSTHTQRLIDCDDAIRGNPRSYGIDYFVDIRAGVSTLNFSGVNASDFNSTSQLWSEQPPMLRTHLSLLGKQLVANVVAAHLPRIPARPLA